ncbi:phenylalanyl-tRNA synthetase like protein [Zymoseptoria brevis]|uniref:Phenylalanine--tRNA ligase beta subunit n=1 Tax=Zymoseptoria brevis TaxID=1047168 RepID=A0A0F4GHI9_9PEZI|nr:phenylalanyl-tRNA synthetase like protein [Zymoseptoria brevis]
MPTIAVDKEDLYKALGKEYTKDEFDELCFEFGIELDEDTSEHKRPIVDGVEERPQLKIEIPANRYDMLCFEGIAMNLNVFLGRQEMPKFRLAAPPSGELQTVTLQESTSKIRPYFSCAILRNIKFDKARYDSFIALQDKLHANLARQRTLVSIGTHDLDTIEGPFSYEALAPEEISFAPLNQTKVMNGKEMMEFYEKDKHLSRFLHIIRDSPVYPIIYDKNRTVLSLPPIINSNHSKITLDTKNVFIDITATDKTKLEIVNNIIVSMFSQYCAEPFTIEPVKIISAHNGESRETPDLTPRATQASSSFINSVCGLTESRENLCELLKKMGHSAKPSTTDSDVLDIDIPVTRADVLHQADIMEDAAVAYGFNNLPQNFPSTSGSTAAALPINKLGDIVRQESAMAGWSEVMPLILCSHDENYAWLNQPDDKLAVRLANPKTAEYQIVRTSLIPGLLKTIRENRRHAVPMKIFEVADVCYQDKSLERRSRNERHFAAAWYGKSSGFEQVHGLMDRIMLMLRAKFIEKAEDREKVTHKQRYWIEEVENPTYLAGHAAAIMLSLDGGVPARIGTFGILHPTVLKHFDLPFPTSTLEINLEVFL